MRNGLKNSVRWARGMSEKGISTVTNIRVRYAETDGMRVVYHGNYLTYFEQARTELLRTVGLPYAALEKLGIFVVVIEAHLQYRRSAVYDDILHVRATVNEMPTNKITIAYTVTRNNESETIVEGYTQHTFLHSQSGKPVKPPKEFIDVMKKYF